MMESTQSWNDLSMGQLIEYSSVIATIVDLKSDSKTYYVSEILKKDDFVSFPYEIVDEYQPATPIPTRPKGNGRSTEHIIFMSGRKAELKLSYETYDDVVLVDGPEFTLQDLREGIAKMKQIESGSREH